MDRRAKSFRAQKVRNVNCLKRLLSTSARIFSHFASFLQGYIFLCLSKISSAVEIKKHTLIYLIAEQDVLSEQALNSKIHPARFLLSIYEVSNK